MKREVKISADSAATILLVNSALGLILDDGLTTESIEELETLYDHLGDVITDMSERNEWNERERRIWRSGSSGTWETARRSALTILSSGSRLWKAIALTCPRSRNSTAIFTRRLHVTPSQGGFRSHKPESKGNL